jgi:hypothetical protein
MFYEFFGRKVVYVSSDDNLINRFNQNYPPYMDSGIDVCLRDVETHQLFKNVPLEILSRWVWDKYVSVNNRLCVFEKYESDICIHLKVLDTKEIIKVCIDDIVEATTTQLRSVGFPRKKKTKFIDRWLYRAEHPFNISPWQRR